MYAANSSWKIAFGLRMDGLSDIYTYSDLETVLLYFHL